MNSVGEKYRVKQLLQQLPPHDNEVGRTFLPSYQQIPNLCLAIPEIENFFFPPFPYNVEKVFNIEIFSSRITDETLNDPFYFMKEEL